MSRGFIKWVGKNWKCQRKKEEWASWSFIVLIKLYLQSNVGAFWKMKTTLSLELWKLNIIRGVRFLKHKGDTDLPMPAGVKCSLLKEWLIWRIGNGTSVQIWGDKWLPRLSTYAVQSQPIILNKDSKVSALINDDMRWWNQTLLQENFSQEEMQLIQSIPIGSTSQCDVQIWRGTASGSFMVRSAYHLAKELSTTSKVESS